MRPAALSRRDDREPSGIRPVRHNRLPTKIRRPTRSRSRPTAGSRPGTWAGCARPPDNHGPREGRDHHQRPEPLQPRNRKDRGRHAGRGGLVRRCVRGPGPGLEHRPARHLLQPSRRSPETRRSRMCSVKSGFASPSKLACSRPTSCRSTAVRYRKPQSARSSARSLRERLKAGDFDERLRKVDVLLENANDDPRLVRSQRVWRPRRSTSGAAGDEAYWLLSTTAA